MASMLPAAMVNPAAAQRAKLGWEAEQTYAELVSLLNELGDDGKLSHHTGIFRVAVDENLRDNFFETWESTSWPDGWCSWVTEEELVSQIPDLCPNYGGLDLHVGFWVDVQAFLASLKSELQSSGVEIIEAEDYSYDSTSDTITITFPDRNLIQSDRLIFSTGSDLRNHPLWSLLPMHGVKGQNAIFRLDRQISWRKPVVGYGYAIPLDASTICVGATYEHEFEDAEPNQEGAQLMREKFEQLLPELAKSASLKYQCSGVRLSTPNRLPMAGPHPTDDRLQIFSGLGSKGVQLAPYSARLMSQYLTEGEPLPPELDGERHWRKLRRQGKV